MHVRCFWNILLGGGRLFILNVAHRFPLIFRRLVDNNALILCDDLGLKLCMLDLESV
jgi:hypothetical protein